MSSGSRVEIDLHWLGAVAHLPDVAGVLSPARSEQLGIIVQLIQYDGRSNRQVGFTAQGYRRGARSVSGRPGGGVGGDAAIVDVGTLKAYIRAKPLADVIAGE